MHRKDEFSFVCTLLEKLLLVCFVVVDSRYFSQNFLGIFQSFFQNIYTFFFLIPSLHKPHWQNWADLLKKLFISNCIIIAQVKTLYGILIFFGRRHWPSIFPSLYSWYVNKKMSIYWRQSGNEDGCILSMMVLCYILP